MAEKSAARSRKGRDIAADMPAVVNPTRKEAGRFSLEFFLRTYLPTIFHLPWSRDHRTALLKLETAALHGGQFAYAMPRGSGKTSLAEGGALWATLYGHRQFPVVIGSDYSAALSLLDNLKMSLETGNALYEDFPEVCYPIRRLEGVAARCNGQLFDGDRTFMEWTADRVVFPSIPGSDAAGAIICVAGITGGIRGLGYTRPDGKRVRPDLVILDDPQTDESARSPSQVEMRMRIVNGTVMGLAGPKRRIAAFMPCTVVAPGDLAERYLDQKRHPQWQGERAKLMYALPANQPLWERYEEIRADSLRAGNGGREATEFYKANREQMDQGAEPAWPSRFNEDEASAVQYAMNLRFDLGQRAFDAEYQNAPLPDQLGDDVLTGDEIARRVNNVPRGRAPLCCDQVKAFIDVQGQLLYYAVCAFGGGFAGAVIDYGTFPDQQRPYFSYTDAKRTLEKAFPKAGLEGRIYNGLRALTDKLVGATFRREDGLELSVDRVHIDAGWGETAKTIYQFCRESPHKRLLRPSIGRGIGASAAPMSAYTRREGEKRGDHWLMPALKPGEVTQHVVVDTNHWKSFVHARLRTPLGDKGTLTLFGSDTSGETHRMLAEQLTAEYAVRTSAMGRTIDEWKLKPGRPDNHLFDCIVGCYVAASMAGARIELSESRGPVERTRPRPRRRRVVPCEES